MSIEKVFSTIELYKEVKQQLFQVEEKINELLEENECNFQGAKYLNLALEKIEFGIGGLEYYYKIKDEFDFDNFENAYEPYAIKINTIIRQIQDILESVTPTGDNGVNVIKEELKRAIIWLNLELKRSIIVYNSIS